MPPSGDPAAAARRASDLKLDFRDPYVFKGPDGRWKMLLGGRDHAAGVILLYETADRKQQEAGVSSVFSIARTGSKGNRQNALAWCRSAERRTPGDAMALIFGLLTSRTRDRAGTISRSPPSAASTA